MQDKAKQEFLKTEKEREINRLLWSISTEIRTLEKLVGEKEAREMVKNDCPLVF